MFSKKDVLQNLPRKGFETDKTGHHIYLKHLRNGRLTGAYTFVSHGPNELLGHGIVRSMKRQLRLGNSKDVHDLIECPMSKSQYNKILEGL